MRKKIITKQQHRIFCDRIEELLLVVGNDTPVDSKDFIELNFISDLVADFEQKRFPILEVS